MAEKPRPKFGDYIENEIASMTNPTRIGVYVETVRIPRGRMNAGTWLRVTDTRGAFWMIDSPGDAVKIVTVERYNEWKKTF